MADSPDTDSSSNAVVRSPHDALFKTFLGDLTVARDFFRAHLPVDIKTRCDFETLRMEPASFVEPILKQHFADILYSVQIAKSTGYLYVLVEHETNPDALIAWRMHRYSVAAIQQHLQQHKTKTLPIMVPLLFYRGERSPYPHSTDVSELFVDPELARRVWLKPFPLIDLSVIPDEALRTHQSASLMELIQKHIHTRDMMEFIADIRLALKMHWLTPDLFQSVIYYIAQEGESLEPKRFFQTLANEHVEYREEIMTIAQQLRQEGIQAGGEEAMRRVVHQMLANGLDHSMIKACTQLSDEELKALLRQPGH